MILVESLQALAEVELPSNRNPPCDTIFRMATTRPHDQRLLGANVPAPYLRQVNVYRAERELTLRELLVTALDDYMAAHPVGREK